MIRPLLILLALLLGGCSTTDKRPPKAEVLDAVLGNGQMVTAEEVSSALLPPMQLNVPGVDDEQLEPRFDVSVRRVQAGSFFMSLVADTPYSMVVHPDVAGRITLEQKNTTVPEVMEVVRSVYGYPFKRAGNACQVFPNTMHTRIYKVDYLSVVRNGSSKTHSAPGRIGESSSSGSSSQSSGGDNRSSYSQASGGGMGSTVETSHESDFWKELRSALEMIVGSADGRRLAINGQTGMVMVHAMPDELRAVEEYLDASQQSVNRQVILEARILEVELSDGFQSGINWTSLQNSGGDTYVGGLINGGSSFTGSGVGGTAGQGVDLLADTADALASTTAFGGVFGLAVNTTDFNAFIELLETQGTVQVLSSPRVSTVNNQKAVIKVGSDEYFVTGMSTNYQVVNNQAVPNVEVELTPFFSGVALDVTPQISAEGDVVLHVHPAVSDVQEQVKVIDAGASTGTLTMPLAANSVRESDTVVRAHNGQLVVIGGLMQNRSQDEDSGVPFLSDIPLLGGLFKHTRQSERKSELVILLRPMVVDAAGEQWGQELRRTRVGMEALR